MLRITLAQLNMTVGDVSGNLRKMETAARQAHEAQADLVVFSELSLCGYYPEDMLDEPAFLARCARGLQELLAATRQWPGLCWVVGAPTPAHGPGKRLHNSLLVLQDGQVKLQYDKQLLPTYNIFDERRHFEPGRDVAKVLRVGDAQVGFLICEDGWNDSGSDYAVNPFERMADAAPDVVVSINASPSNVGRREQRHQVFSAAARRHGLPIVYVNQVGGHDQIVFDGASFAIEPASGVVFEAERFAEHITTLQLHRGCFFLGNGTPTRTVPAQGLSTMAFYRAQTRLGLRDYARRCGFRKVVVGSSGGIDSALTLALAAEALGPENVTAITMPSRISSSGSVDDSVALCRNLGVELIHHPIAAQVDAFAQQFQASFGEPLGGLTLENLQARVRGTVLMEYSNCYGHLLLTTGNKSELSVGYCTLYGDTNGGLGLLGDLYKTEVFALARHINEAHGREVIPQTIIDKPPSAELAPGQTDQDNLPPYTLLDAILKLLIEGNGLSAAEHLAAQETVNMLQATPEGKTMVEKVRHLLHRSEYKRHQTPPVIRLRQRAFGSGRQMPIAASYDWSE